MMSLSITAPEKLLLSPPVPRKKNHFPSTEPALYFLEDVMNRAACPFFLLGETAHFIKNNLDIEISTPIEVGIKRKHFTKFSKSILEMILPPDAVFSKNEITFEKDGTTVTIKIIDKDFIFLDNPNQVFYRLTHFMIPNPFATYWKKRKYVK